VRYETDAQTELVTYPAGGCLHRTSVSNVDDHLFLMDGKRVAQVFAPLMQRNMDGLPADRIPLNVDRYGNTSAASTLLLLDEDRRTDRVRDGDLVVFMWIGAGNGAMNGYAALVV
jgi:3-oxoacyl-[acyl-carrier-protein] synthase III